MSAMSESSDDENVSFFDANAGDDAPANHEAPAHVPSDTPERRPSGQAQSNTPSNFAAPPPPAAARRARSGSGSATDSFSRSRNRYSLPAPVPAVPAIPAHHLATGKRATLLGKEGSKRSNIPSPVLPTPRPSTSDGPSRRESRQSPLTIRIPREGHGGSAVSAPSTPKRTEFTRRKSLSAAPAQVHQDTLAQLESGSVSGGETTMNRFGRSKNEDLFLELANDQVDADGVRPPSRSERAASRLSFADKRRSLPAAERSIPSSADNRPKTSGHLFANRPSTRLDTATSDLQRHADRYRNTPSHAGYHADDAASLSGFSSSARRNRYSSFQERTTMSPSRLAENIRSPELPQFGRRRPSFGAASAQAHKNRPSQLSAQRQDSQSESPADSSDPKQSNPDSASVDSETADTVWDELDDLKSRIKKLELTGKVPSTSGAAVSGDTSERPRTATTAPTTIDSSPKHERQEKKVEAEVVPEQTAADNFVGGQSAANIHPNLHSALAKAKSLISPALYRPLEATAADALQLAAMTGSAGPQGTAFSAAAIINGVTVSDRHVRRKADTMCRNLTDLCLALCEGKYDASSVVASPVALSTPLASSPSLRYSRNSLGPNDGALTRSGSRPMSRLEARRTSILGSSQRGSSIGNSPSEDVSASEQEGTPSIARPDDPHRSSSLLRPQSRLQRIRQRHYNASDAGAAEDEDPTIRPPSRAMTDVGGRAKPLGPREYTTPQRSPSLRDSLSVRRAHANATAHDGNRELSRVASESGRSARRFFPGDPSTPPVVEEGDGEAEAEGSVYSSAGMSGPSARRVMSLNRHAPRRGLGGEMQGRVASLTGRRRQVAVE